MSPSYSLPSVQAEKFTYEGYLDTYLCVFPIFQYVLKIFYPLEVLIENILEHLTNDALDPLVYDIVLFLLYIKCRYRNDNQERNCDVQKSK